MSVPKPRLEPYVTDQGNTTHDVKDPHKMAPVERPKVERDGDGVIQTVRTTTVILDPESEYAVQIPEEVNQGNQAIDFYDQPLPEEQASESSKPAPKSKS